MVNRAFVDLHMPPGDPLGRRFALRSEPEALLEVIGVVGDVRTSIEPGKPARIPQVYLPSLASPTWGFNLVIAAEEDAADLLAPVCQAIRRVSPETAVFNVARLDSRVRDATADTRFFTGLMTVFAGFVLAQTLSALLFDVAPLDPITFLVMPLLFALAAFAACLLPAQRAVDIEPRVALRDEG